MSIRVRFTNFTPTRPIKQFECEASTDSGPWQLMGTGYGEFSYEYRGSEGYKWLVTKYSLYLFGINPIHVHLFGVVSSEQDTESSPWAAVQPHPSRPRLFTPSQAKAEMRRQVVEALTEKAP